MHISTLRKLYDGLIQGCGLFAGLLLAAMVVLIVANVFGRYTELYSMDWSTAFSEYTLQFSTLIAGPVILRRKGHIFMTVLHQSLSGTAKAIQERLIYLICLALCLGMTYFAADAAVRAYIEHAIDMRSVHIPSWILYASLVFGFGLMTIEFALYLFGTQSMFDTGNQVEREL